MFRVILSFILTLFLFAGLIGTANFMFSTSNEDEHYIAAQVFEKKDNKPSIKEIESVTAANNYRFTSANAVR